MTDIQKEAIRRLSKSTNKLGSNGIRELELVAIGMRIEAERREAMKKEAQ